MTEKVAPQENTGAEAKQPYSSPELVRYGTIEEITEIKAGASADPTEVST